MRLKKCPKQNATGSWSNTRNALLWNREAQAEKMQRSRKAGNGGCRGTSLGERGVGVGGCDFLHAMFLLPELLIWRLRCSG